MKNTLSLIVCLICCNLFSQELVKSTSLNISKNADVFQIVEEGKKQVSLFFCAKINVLSVRFDENLKIIDSITVEKPSKEYDDIVGYSLSGNKCYVYWSSSNGKELLSQCFDYDTKKVVSKPLSIALEKEKIIKRIVVNNVFYTITILKGTGILNFYILTDGNLTKKSVDLTSKRFLGKDDKVTSLWSIISSSTSFETPFSFQTISTETPASLVFSANKRKIYAIGNKLIFTLDNNRRFTQTFTVDLIDFSFSTKMFTQPSIPEDTMNDPQTSQTITYPFDSNSFLINDKIIQIKINSDYMKLSLKNMENEELKNFLINSQEISFKNSDIIQENGSVKSTRILGKSGQLIRKISGTNPSVSLYENDNKIYMVLGGVSDIQQGSMALLGGMYGVTGVLIGMALSSNYSLNNLNSYSQRKVVYINCLFDKDFNHLDGEVKKTAFDEVRAFSEEKSKLTSPVLFKMNSSLFYGGFDKETGNYSFYKFKD